MSKRLVIALYFLATLWMAPVSAQTNLHEVSMDISYESQLLIRRGAVELTMADVVAYIERSVPEENRKEVLADPARLERLLGNLTLIQSFWPLAEQDGLLESEVAKARLMSAVSREVRSIYQDHFRSKVILSSYDTQARELYLTQPELFKGPQTIDFEHIIIQTSEAQDAIGAMRKVADAYELIKQGEPFSEVAARFSDDPSSASLTAVEMSELLPSVRSALESLEEGEFSLPVRSSLGWHIVKLNARNASEVKPWEEVKVSAEEIARNRHLTESYERLLRELNRVPMQFADGAVEQILDYYGLEGFGITGKASEPNETEIP